MDLRDSFFHEMQRICNESAKKCPSYNPSRFRQMLSSCNGDFVPLAKNLLTSPEIQSGLHAVAECGCAEFTLEAVVLSKPWSKLFSAEELAAARWRLDIAVGSGTKGSRGDSD